MTIESSIPYLRVSHGRVVRQEPAAAGGDDPKDGRLLNNEFTTCYSRVWTIRLHVASGGLWSNGISRISAFWRLL